MSANGLVELQAENDGPAPKRARKDKEGALYRLPAVSKGEQLSKLMAIAQYRAEMVRAAQLQREPDWLEAQKHMNMDPFSWGNQRNAIVLWSYKTPEGAWCHEATDMPLKSLGR